MFEEKYIEQILYWDKGHGLDALWEWSKKYPIFRGDLNMAKEGFFYLVERFMSEGILRLASHGIFWEGSIEEQLKRFEEAWPKEYDSTVEEKDIDHMWWYICAPAGAVWIYPDGSEEWT
jgi:hypothetical protein